jgi:hypothetical protein
MQTIIVIENTLQTISGGGQTTLADSDGSQAHSLTYDEQIITLPLLPQLDLDVVMATAEQVLTKEQVNVQVITAGTQGPSGQGVPLGGVPGQFLQKTGISDFQTGWANVIAGVTSVFGRVGTVVAQAGDYAFNQISGLLNLGTQVTSILPIANGGTDASTADAAIVNIVDAATLIDPTDTSQAFVPVLDTDGGNTGGRVSIDYILGKFGSGIGPWRFLATDGLGNISPRPLFTDSATFTYAQGAY